ncbi:hypothetical protein [Vibrio diabolicus]|uniref:hypothetical protein n=1 Tax=Vibrio diabolicus TaxID=50719 RepID=UPI003769749C
MEVIESNVVDIDVVVTWLDSSCLKWQKEFKKYKDGSHDGDSSLPRFRDWDNFHYWFRGIERNMPWIRKVHLVTNGTIPSWLNVEHPKLNLVKHSDYIRQEYLPTFNSRVIELNLKNIDGLSEHFILFNDDFFVISPTQPQDFFFNDLPCDNAIMNAHSGEGISNVLMNNLTLINSTFNKREVMKKNFFSWFNIKYRSGLFRNILLTPWPRFTGFYEPHLPQAYLKSTFNRVWELHEKELLQTCRSRFRLASDVNHFLFRYFQLVENKFHAQSLNWLGCFFQVDDKNYLDVVDYISSSRGKIIAINDGKMNDFELIRNEINRSLKYKFPDKSRFEI